MNFLHRLRGDLETERLYLRRWTRDDMNGFLSFAADPEVTLHAGTKPVETREDAERELYRAIRDEDCFAIVLKATGQPIGKIKLQSDAHRQNRAGSMSVGYQLARAYWGNGYMPEALSAIVTYAFERKGLPVLGVSHFAENYRSRRVIEKCGFHFEGIVRRAYRRFDGAVFDDACYSLLREEYYAAKAEAE